MDNWCSSDLPRGTGGGWSADDLGAVISKDRKKRQMQPRTYHLKYMVQGKRMGGGARLRPKVGQLIFIAQPSQWRPRLNLSQHFFVAVGNPTCAWQIAAFGAFLKPNLVPADPLRFGTDSLLLVPPSIPPSILY